MNSILKDQRLNWANGVDIYVKGEQIPIASLIYHLEKELKLRKKRIPRKLKKHLKNNPIPQYGYFYKEEFDLPTREI